MTTGELITIILGSGVVSAATSGSAALAGGRWERRHRTTERQAVAEHEAQLRREKAHDDARPTFLPDAELIAVWADHTVSEIHWEEVGSNYPVPPDVAVPDKKQVLGLLRNVRYGHPTKAVREGARSLYVDVWNRLTEIVGGEIPDPSLEEALGWLERSQTLIELIHSQDPSNREK